MEKSIYTSEHVVLTRLLRQCREERGYTQTELGELLGQSQSFVSKFERGDRRLDFVQLREVCRVLGVTLVDFAKRFERELKKG
ncbi:MAG: transcriptional regulator [Porticoccaceae bacterium]|nr:transcriptional regulator [Porticoccaceae bacterium]